LLFVIFDIFFYDILFADICEDPEIRERILHLKSEQESKRAQEQQRRRGVRRSQSNNTRTQNVRRTSIRDKGLTSKKEAVAEARLRIQARDVIIFFSQNEITSIIHFNQAPATPQNDLPSFDISQNGGDPMRPESTSVRRSPEGMDSETNDNEQIALGL